MHRPQILFLCETKLRSRQIQKECRNLHFENGFGIRRNGMSGGVAHFWDANVQLEIISYSSHHIDTLVKNGSGKKWKCTRVYGHHDMKQKKRTWMLLRRLTGLFSYP